MFNTLLTAGVNQNVHTTVLHLILQRPFDVLRKLFFNSFKKRCYNQRKL